MVSNNVWIGNDGVTIHSNGHDIGVTMVMGNFSGQIGSLTKTGAGTLKLSTVNTYTGGTTVNAGTLELAGAMFGNGLIRGALTVNPGGTLAITGGDGTGLGFNSSGVTRLTINGGTVNTSGGSHIGFGAFTTVSLGNGGSLAGNWKWNGDNGLGFSTSGDSTNTLSGSLVLRSDDGTSHTFNVADGAAGIDLLVAANLSDRDFTWEAASALIKSGAGTMALSGANSYHGSTTVDEGTLQVTSSGSLRFYPTSDRTSNSVNGYAALSFLGTVDLDLSAADTTPGNTWTLFDLSGFSSHTLAPAAVTSSLGSFTLASPGVWELPVSGAKWTFSAATGNLSYVAAATDYEVWGSLYGVTVGSEKGDLDNDGLSNASEYAFGLLPNSGASVNPIAVPLSKATGSFSYTRRRPSLTGLTYSVWVSTNLLTWTEDTGAIQGTPVTNGDVETVPVTITETLLTHPKLFVQVRAN